MLTRTADPGPVAARWLRSAAEAKLRQSSCSMHVLEIWQGLAATETTAVLQDELSDQLCRFWSLPASGMAIRLASACARHLRRGPLESEPATLARVLRSSRQFRHYGGGHFGLEEWTDKIHLQHYDTTLHRAVLEQNVQAFEGAARIILALPLPEAEHGAYIRIIGELRRQLHLGTPAG